MRADTHPDSISSGMQSEIFVTLLVFVSSNNREIVKSTLGYIKLAIHTMPVELLRPHLQPLVTALLGWSHDHKNHFKSKVRHIFERMIRRFGWEDDYACAEEDDARKVLTNIKKRKERAKRKKAHNVEEEEGADDQVRGICAISSCHVLIVRTGGTHQTTNRRLLRGRPLRQRERTR